jgi:hypothetical protein
MFVHSIAISLIAPLSALAWHGPYDSDHPHTVATARSSTVIGDGQFTYKVTHDWGQLPDGSHAGPTHGGVVVDRQNNIYVSTERNGHSVIVYDAAGQLKRTFGGSDYLGLHDLTMSREGRADVLYAAFLAGKQIVKFESSGRAMWTLDWPKESGKYKERSEYNPTAVAVAANGDIFVGDGYGQKWIHRYDRNPKYVSSFGGPGKEPQHLSNPHGLAIDNRYTDERLIVCDRENRRLVHYDLEGKYLGEVAKHLWLPCAVSFWGEYVAVAELQGRVTILDGNNKPVIHLGQNPDESQRANFNVPPEEWKPGVFTAPHSVAFDSSGNLYVQDWNRTGRLTRLTRVKK